VDLSCDPGEWTWEDIHTLKATNFFIYETKRGHKSAMWDVRQPSTIARIFELEGTSKEEAGRIYGLLWHPARPRKISTFLWAVANSTIATRAWLERIKHHIPPSCVLCNQDA
jgi:hypothetical protein